MKAQTPRLEKESSVPLYVQLAAALEKAIHDGAYPEGGRIEPEPALAVRYGVSRVTIRQAMQTLLAKNLITRRQGKGTFVRRTVVTQTTEEVFGFYPSLLSKGLKPQTRLLEYRVVPPDPETQENLRLPPGEKVLRFTRQYTLGPSVLVVICMFIPFSLAGQWTREEAARKNSLRLLQENASVALGGSGLRIRAATASRQMGKWLKIPAGSPVLELRRLTHSTEQKPVEYAFLVFPGDAYELTTGIGGGEKTGLVLVPQG